jgi:hypothetical protein
LSFATFWHKLLFAIGALFPTPKIGVTDMAKQNEDTRDASLRVSKRVRDSLKAAAAVSGRPLYDVTNEAINNYLASAKTGGARKAKK